MLLFRRCPPGRRPRQSGRPRTLARSSSSAGPLARVSLSLIVMPRNLYGRRRARESVGKAPELPLPCHVSRVGFTLGLCDSVRVDGIHYNHHHHDGISSSLAGPSCSQRGHPNFLSVLLLVAAILANVRSIGVAWSILSSGVRNGSVWRALHRLRQVR